MGHWLLLLGLLLALVVYGFVRAAGRISRQDDKLTEGEWVHCSPELLASGISCADTRRRKCTCGLDGSHDHWISVGK